MKKVDVVKIILKDQYLQAPKNQTATAFAPTNIALVKYWGKRNQELNLPVTSSLSISLANKGAQTTLSVHDKDSIFLNNQEIAMESSFAVRLIHFLNLFRPSALHLKIDIQANIPIAAGLASSACGFAALVMALNKLFAWQLTEDELSILARLGSGSAARSIWNGFVEWQRGHNDDGMDSFAKRIEFEWPELCIGLHIMTTKEKHISSRVAMQRTVETSPLYIVWPEKVFQDMKSIKKAIQQKDFDMLGKTAESNALNMHATMLSAWPPVSYALPDTVTAMQKIWKLREEGLPLYFTQDAGPNLKLLFEKKDLVSVQNYFPLLEIIHPFEAGV